jgi:protein-tyrosine phosphatase
MFQSQIKVPIVNTYWVIPSEFLAGEHPVELEERMTVERLTALLDAGIRTFVNLTQEREKMQTYFGHLHTMAIDRQIKIENLQIPIPDRGIPSIECMKSILDAIDNSFANKNPVFVHCFAGVGRTGTVVGCYLKRHGQAKRQDVIKKISGLRRLMPGGREASPHTPEQIQFVKNWEEGS